MNTRWRDIGGYAGMKGKLIDRILNKLLDAQPPKVDNLNDTPVERDPTVAEVLRRGRPDKGDEFDIPPAPRHPSITTVEIERD
jgi:hypothetical protein